MMSRIAFVTDLHLNLRGLAYGINTDRNFDLVLEKIMDWNVDHIVCGGDLSLKEPRLEDVENVFKKLESSQIPYSVIKGNHDDAEHFSSVFKYEKKDNEVYFDKRIGGRTFLFLDSNRGSISRNQLDWLQDKMERIDRPILFMHYPPVKTGIAFMDSNHEFQTSEEFLEVIENSKQDIHLFCGHCHAERFLQVKNLHIHITPSTISQIDERSEEVLIAHYKIAFRIIEVGASGSLTTFTKYLI